LASFAHTRLRFGLHRQLRACCEVSQACHGDDQGSPGHRCEPGDPGAACLRGVGDPRRTGKLASLVAAPNEPIGRYARALMGLDTFSRWLRSRTRDFRSLPPRAARRDLARPLVLDGSLTRPGISLSPNCQRTTTDPSSLILPHDFATVATPRILRSWKFPDAPCGTIVPSPRVSGRTRSLGEGSWSSVRDFYQMCRPVLLPSL